MILTKKYLKKSAIYILSLVFFFTHHQAKAVSAGDAALTVAIATASGAVLGASTLPFYAKPGDNTKNIFYGAALGAVAGVLFAAYAGIQEGAEEDMAYTRIQNKYELAKYTPSTVSIGNQVSDQSKTLLAWSPVFSWKF